MSPRRSTGRWWEDPRYIPTEVRVEIELRLRDHAHPYLDRQIERSCSKWYEAMRGKPPSPYAHKIKWDGVTPGLGRMAESFARLNHLEENHRVMLKEIRELRDEVSQLRFARSARPRSESPKNGNGHAAG